MKNVEFDFTKGLILIEGYVVAPLNLDDFLRVTEQHLIETKDCTRNQDWPTYGLETKINVQDFWMNVSFHQKELHSVWFLWNGGIAGKKGYDTTENELITDKNSLTKILVKIIGKQPEVKEYNHNVFLFDWGYISIAASLQSAMVTIGVSWQTFNKT